MPRIRCHYLDCIFLDEKLCSAAAVEMDPDKGCLTYSPNEEGIEDDWEDEEWEDEGFEEEEEEDDSDFDDDWEDDKY